MLPGRGDLAFYAAFSARGTLFDYCSLTLSLAKQKNKILSRFYKYFFLSRLARHDPFKGHLINALRRRWGIISRKGAKPQRGIDTSILPQKCRIVLCAFASLREFLIFTKSAKSHNSVKVLASCKLPQRMKG